MKLISSLDAGKRHHITPLSLETFPSCKRSFSTRNIPGEVMKTLITGDLTPQPGDLVLARIDRLRQHLRIEQPDGRRARLFPGDHVLLCYGNRYAADQYESVVPDDLEPCHLVAAGGIASLMRHRHPRVKPPTEISPLGLVGDAEGVPLNLRGWKIDRGPENRRNIPSFLVVGSAMNAGKTTTAAQLTLGLVQDGFKVGVMKVTGTGSGGDLWHFLDAGATSAVDFTDAGYASTYRLRHQAVLNITQFLGNYSRNQNIDALVVEVADGLLQAETHALLVSPIFLSQFSGVLHAAVDAHSALFGVEFLQHLGYKVLAVSGVVSSSPLASQEFSSCCAVPILTKNQLCTPGFGLDLIEKVTGRRDASLAKA